MKNANPSSSAELYHDTISQRARELWRARGQPAGRDVEIWLDAEKELVQRGEIPAAPPRRHRTKLRADEIDPRAVAERVPGPPDAGGARSATAVDPTDLT